MAVLVLQPLAVERGAAGRPAEQEAAGARVPGRPDQVHHPLEAEHRVEDVERDHRDVAGAVGGRGGDPGRHRAGLVDALLQHLAVRRPPGSTSAGWRPRAGRAGRPAEDAELAEHALHPERPGLIGHDRHHAAGRCALSRSSVFRIRTNAIVVEICRPGVPPSCPPNAELGHRQRSCDRLRRARQVAAERGPPLPQVGHLLAVLRRSAGTAARPAARRTAAGRTGRGTWPGRASAMCFCWWVMFWPSPDSPIP